MLEVVEDDNLMLWEAGRAIDRQISVARVGLTCAIRLGSVCGVPILEKAA